MSVCVNLCLYDIELRNSKCKLITDPFSCTFWFLSSFHEIRLHTYIIELQAADDNLVFVSVPENVTRDVAGNKNLASNVLQVRQCKFFFFFFVWLCCYYYIVNKNLASHVLLVILHFVCLMIMACVVFLLYCFSLSFVGCKLSSIIIRHIYDFMNHADSVPLVSSVVSAFATASFVLTSLVAGLLTISTASLQSVGTFMRSSSFLIVDPARSLFVSYLTYLLPPHESECSFMHAYVLNCCLKLSIRVVDMNRIFWLISILFILMTYLLNFLWQKEFKVPYKRDLTSCLSKGGT